jgi:hypothetical protein
VQPWARFPDTASPGWEYPVPLLGSVWNPRGSFQVPTGTTNQVTSALLKNQPAGMWTGGIYLGVHYAGFLFQSANITNSTSNSTTGNLTVSPITGKWFNSSSSEPEWGRGRLG